MCVSYSKSAVTSRHMITFLLRAARQKQAVFTLAKKIACKIVHFSRPAMFSGAGEKCDPFVFI